MSQSDEDILTAVPGKEALKERKGEKVKLVVLKEHAEITEEVVGERRWDWVRKPQGRKLKVPVWWNRIRLWTQIGVRK